MLSFHIHRSDPNSLIYFIFETVIPVALVPQITDVCSSFACQHAFPFVEARLVGLAHVSVACHPL
jgi:hypothetical protein